LRLNNKQKKDKKKTSSTKERFQERALVSVTPNIEEQEIPKKTEYLVL